MVVKVTTTKHLIKNSFDTCILFDIIFDNDHKQATQSWQITCKNIIYSITNKIHEPKLPFKSISIYDQHPVLWNFSNNVFVIIKGQNEKSDTLFTDLLRAHYNLCGNWVDFLAIFSPKFFNDSLNSTIKISYPEELNDAYKKVFTYHNIELVLKEKVENKTNLKALIFGNPRTCSDFICFGQPYIVAESFEAIQVS